MEKGSSGNLSMEEGIKAMSGRRSGLSGNTFGVTRWEGNDKRAVSASWSCGGKKQELPCNLKSTTDAVNVRSTRSPNTPTLKKSLAIRKPFGSSHIAPRLHIQPLMLPYLLGSLSNPTAANIFGSRTCVPSGRRKSARKYDFLSPSRYLSSSPNTNLTDACCWSTWALMITRPSAETSSPAAF